VNLPDKKEVAVIDLERNTVKARWPVASAQANFPMAMDEAGHQLLVGCRSPARLLVFDTATGKQSAAADIVSDTDDLFYDAAKNRAYVVGGGGFVDVIERTNPGKYIRTGRYPTAAGARTGLFVPEWGELFVAVPHRGEQKASILVFKTE
jgi:DNA-binding beta-propeller fold protein YncE